MTDLPRGFKQVSTAKSGPGVQLGPVVIGDHCATPAEIEQIMRWTIERFPEINFGVSSATHQTE